MRKMYSGSFPAVPGNYSDKNAPAVTKPCSVTLEDGKLVIYGTARPERPGNYDLRISVITAASEVPDGVDFVGTVLVPDAGALHVFARATPVDQGEDQ